MFLEQKIRAGFAHLDADGDGFLTEDDHILMGQRSAAALGYAAGSRSEQFMIDSYLRVWRIVHQSHAIEGKVSAEEFLAAMLALRANPAVLTDLANALFSIADRSGNGRIDLGEYLAFLQGQAPNLPEAEGIEAFSHLDRDSDGHLTREELARAVVEYWTSDNLTATGNWLLGHIPVPS
ncbi:EF-hand domain-containing protein [Actinocrispum sp. NPDC049592]|uniref:EF-hand domain-containing protein n=1 Tax=Actinocrispum sp. NPDC049592 TaxID=3154835 RepID=UPI0034423E93